ncbi:hypothetical protein Peur_018768 [Populus x canadensis]
MYFYGLFLDVFFPLICFLICWAYKILFLSSCLCNIHSIWLQIIQNYGGDEMSKSCKGLAVELVKRPSEYDCIKALHSLVK